MVFVSLVLGFPARAMIHEGALDAEGITVISSVLLNVFLLPIILFDGGWALSRFDFIREFDFILIFALLGTVVSTAAIALMCFYAGPALGHNLPLRDCAVFGALISAVDPVATLSSYGKLNMQVKQPLLNTIVFGESAINDAVAIILFDVLNTSQLERLHNWHVYWNVFRLLFLSIIFGVLMAVFLVGMIRLARLRENFTLVTLYCFSSAYFVFTLAETIHLSGIIATLFAGMVFNLYGGEHLTKEQKHGASEFLEKCASFSDNCVFMICGAASSIINRRGLKFPLLALLFCLIARAISVFTSSCASNLVKCCIGDRRLITWKHQVMMWHGGLRGGIALLLALEIGSWCKHKDLFVEATFIIIVVLLLVCGSSTEAMFALVGMPESGAGEDVKEHRLLQRGLMRIHGAIKCSLVGSMMDKAESTAWGRHPERASEMVSLPSVRHSSLEDVLS